MSNPESTGNVWQRLPRRRRTAAETVRDDAQHASETCSIRPSKLSIRCMPAMTKRNASSAIGRESRCLCVSEWV